jgi:hypothetical protein
MTGSTLRLGLVSLAAALALPGCTTAVPLDFDEGAFEPGRQADLGDDPVRELRRMDLDQLDASLTQAAGGLRWMVGRTPGFVRFEDTLGVPDYINSSAEDLTVSLLFTKFLDDAARSVCNRLVNGRDEDEVTARAEVFDVVDPSTDEELLDLGRDAQLRSLLLRFHGRRLQNDEELQPWQDLFETARALGDRSSSARGWQAVCVTLVNHPDFYTY